MKGPRSLGVVIKLGKYLIWAADISLSLFNQRLSFTPSHTHTPPPPGAYLGASPPRDGLPSLTPYPPGTSSIVDEKSHEPLLSILSLIVETAVKLRKDGHRVIIVSSGAIGVGLRRMDREKRPKHLSKLQVRLDPLCLAWSHH